MVLVLACTSPREIFDLEDAATAFRQIHAQVYRVYGLGADRDRIHDLLASTFADEALTREYVEHFTTLVRMGREETSIQVLHVDYESVEVTATRDGALEVDADWSVGGLVTHQRHRHPRVNRYRAIYRLVPRAGVPAGRPLVERLRIVSTRLRSLERVRGAGLAASPFDGSPTSARGSFGIGDLIRSGVVEAGGKQEEASDRDTRTPPP